MSNSMKNLTTFFFACAVLITLSLKPHSLIASDLVVGYPEFKPYTYTLKGQPKGIGFQAIKQLNETLNIDLSYEPIATYKNGMTRLKHNKLDALMLATQNTQRDEVAVFSSPIALNKWSWFTLKEKQLDFKNLYNKKNLRITTYDNANTHRWLIDNNYGTIYTTTDITAMLRQLINKRIDAIFVSEAVLLEALNKTEIKEQDLRITVEIAKPMGIYINKKYIEKNPNFMERLNAAIDSTLPKLQ